MSWAAVAGAVGAIGGALISRGGARDAANAQAGAADRAAQTQWDIYTQNRTDSAPWRTAGEGALGQLTSGLQPGGTFNRDFTMDDFTKDPGYDFRMGEGMKAIERSRAGRGGLYGGAAGKALTRYGQDYASGEYTNAFNRYMMQRNAQYNRLAGVSGTGQTATEQLGNQGVMTGNYMGQNIVGAGNARASGYVGSARAINQGVSGVNSAWQNYVAGQNSGWNPAYTTFGGGPTYTGYDSDGGPAYG